MLGAWNSRTIDFLSADHTRYAKNYRCLSQSKIDDKAWSKKTCYWSQLKSILEIKSFCAENTPSCARFPATFIAIRGIIIICPLVGTIRGSCIEKYFWIIHLRQIESSPVPTRIILLFSVNEFWSKTGEFLTNLMSWFLVFYASYNFTDCSIAFWNELGCIELIMVRDKCRKSTKTRMIGFNGYAAF